MAVVVRGVGCGCVCGGGVCQHALQQVPGRLRRLAVCRFDAEQRRVRLLDRQPRLLSQVQGQDAPQVRHGREARGEEGLDALLRQRQGANVSPTAHLFPAELIRVVLWRRGS
jgi:hypothetical protein